MATCRGHADSHWAVAEDMGPPRRERVPVVHCSPMSRAMAVPSNRVAPPHLYRATTGAETAGHDTRSFVAAAGDRSAVARRRLSRTPLASKLLRGALHVSECDAGALLARRDSEHMMAMVVEHLMHGDIEGIRCRLRPLNNDANPLPIEAPSPKPDASVALANEGCVRRLPCPDHLTLKLPHAVPFAFFRHPQRPAARRPSYVSLSCFGRVPVLAFSNIRRRCRHGIISRPRGQVHVQMTPVPPSRLRRLSFLMLNTSPGIGNPVRGSFPGEPCIQLPTFIELARMAK